MSIDYQNGYFDMEHFLISFADYSVHPDTGIDASAMDTKLSMRVDEALSKLPIADQSYIRRVCGFDGNPAWPIAAVLSDDNASNILRHLRQQ